MATNKKDSVQRSQSMSHTAASVRVFEAGSHEEMPQGQA